MGESLSCVALLLSDSSLSSLYRLYFISTFFSTTSLLSSLYLLPLIVLLNPSFFPQYHPIPHLFPLLLCPPSHHTPSLRPLLLTRMTVLRGTTTRHSLQVSSLGLGLPHTPSLLSSLSYPSLCSRASYYVHISALSLHVTTPLPTLHPFTLPFILPFLTRPLSFSHPLSLLSSPYPLTLPSPILPFPTPRR